MNWNLWAYDWTNTEDRSRGTVLGAHERVERPQEDRVVERDLERLRLSLSSIVSAWGIYAIMLLGLLAYSAL